MTKLHVNLGYTHAMTAGFLQIISEMQVTYTTKTNLE
jgi:hypothetical protein